MGKKRLTELEPEWYYRDGKIVGLFWLCPACDVAHNLAVTWQPPSLFPSGAVWKKTGETFEDLTLTPSVDATVSGVCKFHGFITKGDVTW